MPSSKNALLVIVCVVACLSGRAWSQSKAPVPRDLEELRKIHEDDEAERAQFPLPRPLPKPSGKHHEVIRESRLLWTCLGTDAGQPIYAEPDPHSRVIAMPAWAAAVGGDEGHFVRVLLPGGAVGYLRVEMIHDYADPEHPGVTCSFRGLNAFGGAVLDLHPAAAGERG